MALRSSDQSKDPWQNSLEASLKLYCGLSLNQMFFYASMRAK
jgi:hypothetical protein